MEQLREQVLQLAHLFLSASRCSLGRLALLLNFRPMTMKGAIQQIVWQAARLPAMSAKSAMVPAMAANIIADVKSEIEIPYHVW
jgi:hypothetical protein